MRRRLTHTLSWRTPTVVGVLCTLIALLVPLGVSGGPAAAADTPDTPASARPTCTITVSPAPADANPGTCAVGAAFQSNLGTTYPFAVTNTPIVNTTWQSGNAEYSMGAFGDAYVDMTAPVLIDPSDCMRKYGFVAVNGGNGIQTSNPGPYACTLDIGGGSGMTVIKWNDNTTNFGYCTWFPPDIDKICTNGGPTFAITINWTGATVAPPTPAFTATQADPANNPGKYQFTDDSTDTDGGALTEAWNFGDGTTGTGVSVLHTYTKPGTYTASLTVKDQTSGLTAVTSKTITIPAPTLQLGLNFVDAHGNVLTSVSPLVGDTVLVRLSLSASQTGVGALNRVAVVPGTDAVSATPSSAVSVGAPTPALPASQTLTGGQSVSYTYAVKVVAAGIVRFTSAFTAVDDSGNTVTATPAQLSFGVSSLQVTITSSPSTFTLDENANGPVPKIVTVTETITNLTNQNLTSVNLRSFSAQRTTSGQLLNVTLVKGPSPDPIAGFPLPDLHAGGSQVFTSTFSVASNGKIAINSLVTAASPDGTTLRGYGTATLNVAPQYWLEFTSHVQNSGRALPAGSPIVITGSVHNVSDTATEDVGPLFAQTIGNAGLQGLAYNGAGVSPQALKQPGALTLDPGDTKDFTLKVLTAYSDPLGNGGVLPSHGTSATLTWTPWAKVTQADGTTFTTTADDIESTPDDLSRRISIDDSIALPSSADPIAEPSAIAGGLLLGGAEGIWNAASGIVGGLASGLMSLGTAPGSALYAVSQYQDEVWNSFTPAERDAFASSAASAIVPVLLSNAELAAKGAGKLWQQADAFTLQYFTTLDNDWQVGNYAQSVTDYTRLGTDAVGQFAMPMIMGELITSRAAAGAVELKQEANLADAAQLTSGLSSAETVAEAVPSLTTIPSGVPLTPTLVQRMFGISPAELAAFQKLADENQFLMVVRSRATSSLDWLNNFAAMVKPEALKIKSVSEMDVALGYSASSEGSLVFKQPIPYTNWLKSGGKGRYADYVEEFVQSKGFTPGTEDYQAAIDRINLRTDEWKDYSKLYSQWSKRGWIDVSFNWEGNAMADPTRSGSGKYAGFHLAPTGVPNEYQVQMYNPTVGRFVPVTGDIDPISFTHVDGTPLSAAEHARLVNQMRLNPILQTQHGESATFIKGGLKFITKQFKPNEVGLMIGPDESAPRTVRLNTNDSTWKSATDYKLVWDGGFIDAGSAPVAPEVTVPVDAPTPLATMANETALPIPGDGTTADPNVGRCAFTFSTAAGTPALEMSPKGTIVQIIGTTTVTSSLEKTCFSTGPVIDIKTQPSTATSTTVPAGTTEVPVQTGGSTAGNSTTDGFAVGDQVSIDPGTADAEEGTISGFGSIIFSKPLRFAHPAGTVLTVIAEPAHPASTGAHALAYTGAGPLAGDLETGLALLLTGGLALGVSRRRRAVRAVRTTRTGRTGRAA